MQIGGSVVNDDHDSTSELERRLRARTLLMAQFEHKLKTSLTVVVGWSSLLEERWSELTDAERLVGIGAIGRSARQLITQAEGLLEESQAEVRSLELDPLWLDLSGVLRLSTETFRGASTRHRIVFAGEEGITALVDPAALQQVLGYLIENAVKYSEPGTLVTLGVTEADGEVHVTVVDEGVGIPADVDLFAPFQRGASSTTGAGLGLYIVRNLADAMGATVSATRNATGGSTFTVSLPTPSI